MIVMTESSICMSRTSVGGGGGGGTTLKVITPEKVVRRLTGRKQLLLCLCEDISDLDQVDGFSALSSLES